MFRRHSLHAAFIGAYPADIDPEPTGEVLFIEAERPALASDASADVTVNRCHRHTIGRAAVNSP